MLNNNDDDDLICTTTNNKYNNDNDNDNDNNNFIQVITVFPLIFSRLWLSFPITYLISLYLYHHNDYHRHIFNHPRHPHPRRRYFPLQTLRLTHWAFLPPMLSTNQRILTKVAVYALPIKAVQSKIVISLRALRKSGNK